MNSVNILKQIANNTSYELNLDSIKPEIIKNNLDDYIIGQDSAKKTLSIAVYNHYKRFTHGKENVIDKGNIMMIGSTGTGKTLMARTIANLLGVPMYIADATSLTQAGYVGDDVESMLTGLLQVANYDVKLAQRGIIFIDEIDKLSRNGDSPSITKDVSGEGVQQALLKITEGTIVGVPPHGGRKHPEQALINVDTRNILFIGSGAFDGIEEILERKLNTRRVGYTKEMEVKSNDIDTDNIIKYVSQEDLRTYGMIPELIGRFPIITHTNTLREEDLIRILKEPKNAIIEQYKTLFMLDGNTLLFTDESIELIAQIALKVGVGARGLKSIIEDILQDDMFLSPNLNGTTITVDKEYVSDRLSEKYKIKL